MRKAFKHSFGTSLLGRFAERLRCSLPSKSSAASGLSATESAEGDLPCPHADESLYQRGDVIGVSYRIKDLIGQGGFGQVYHAYFRNSGKDCALKTFHDKYLGNPAARARFRTEASLWVALERHPHIVPAYLVEEIDGRLFVAMEYIEPDPKRVAVDARDRVSLLRFLRGTPLDTDQVLEWCLQFCWGLEHAYSHGVRAHLDIKPQNILVGPDNKMRITDFGIAEAVGEPGRGELGGSPVSSPEDLATPRTPREHRGVCGTPGYIAPEVYLQGSAAADARSDIYSFGLVMWQMAGGSWTPPFHVAPQGDLSRYLSRIYDLQTGGPAPRIETPLWDMIERALQVDPARRYGSFAELREDLAALLRRETGRAPAVPCQPPPDADFWNNRGISLECLGRSKQAVDCYDKAIAADASHTHAWTNKGFALRGLGRHEQALHCFDRALAIDTGFAYAWHGRAGVLTSLQRYEEALDNYRRALQTDPDFYVAWGGQAHVLSLLGQYEQAEACYDEVLRRDRRNVEALTGKALGLERQGRLEEALSCLDQATAWNKIDPALWNNKGGILHGLGEYEKALVCYDEAIVIDDNFVMAWENKARVLISLGRFAQALECLEEVFRRDAARTSALFLQAVCEDALGRPGATASYRRFLAHAVADDPNLEVARQRLTSLECP